MSERTDPESLRRAAAHALGRLGPVSRARLVVVLDRAGVRADDADIDGLVRAGHVVEVRGPDGGALVALPATEPRAASWRRIQDAPPGVLVAATVTALLVLVLLAIVVNSLDASWPVIPWPDPPD